MIKNMKEDNILDEEDIKANLMYDFKELIRNICRNYYADDGVINNFEAGYWWQGEGKPLKAHEITTFENLGKFEQLVVEALSEKIDRPWLGRCNNPRLFILHWLHDIENNNDIPGAGCKSEQMRIQLDNIKYLYNKAMATGAESLLYDLSRVDKLLVFNILYTFICERNVSLGNYNMIFDLLGKNRKYWEKVLSDMNKTINHLASLRPIVPLLDSYKTNGQGEWESWNIDNYLAAELNLTSVARRLERIRDRKITAKRGPKKDMMLSVTCYQLGRLIMEGNRDEGIGKWDLIANLLNHFLYPKYIKNPLTPKNAETKTLRAKKYLIDIKLLETDKGRFAL